MESSWEISSRTKCPDFYIKEVWQFRELLLRFVRRDFLASYKQTALGALWIFIQPLFTALVYVVIFKNVVGISTSGKPGLLFYFGSVILWGFFSESVSAVSYTYNSHAAIFNKVYFPRIVVSYSLLLSSLARLGIQFGIYLLIFFWSIGHHEAVQPNSYVLLLPVLVFLLMLMSMGIGLIFAALSVRYRDLQNLLSFLIRIWMFATPVIYPMAVVPAKYRFILLLNPVTPIMEFFRYGFLGAGMHDFIYLCYAFVFSIVVFVGGIILFNLRDGKVMDII